MSEHFNMRPSQLRKRKRSNESIQAHVPLADDGTSSRCDSFCQLNAKSTVPIATANDPHSILAEGSPADADTAAGPGLSASPNTQEVTPNPGSQIEDASERDRPTNLTLVVHRGGLHAPFQVI